MHQPVNCRILVEMRNETQFAQSLVTQRNYIVHVQVNIGHHKGISVSIHETLQKKAKNGVSYYRLDFQKALSASHRELPHKRLIYSALT